MRVLTVSSGWVTCARSAADAAIRVAEDRRSCSLTSWTWCPPVQVTISRTAVARGGAVGCEVDGGGAFGRAVGPRHDSVLGTDCALQRLVLRDDHRAPGPCGDGERYGAEQRPGDPPVTAAAQDDHRGSVARLDECARRAGDLGGAGDPQGGVGLECFGDAAGGDLFGGFECARFPVEQSGAGFDGHAGVVGREEDE